MERSLGRITANAGVPIRLTANEPDPTKDVICHSYMVEVLPTNKGKVYILDRQGGNGATMTNVLAWLPVPTVNSSPSFTATIDSAPNALNVTNRFLDVDIDGEGVIVSVAIT